MNKTEPGPHVADARQEVTSRAHRVRELMCRLGDIEQGRRRAEAAINEASEVEASTHALQQAKLRLEANAFLADEAPDTREIEAQFAATAQANARITQKGRIAKQARSSLDQRKSETAAELAIAKAELADAQERELRVRWQAAMGGANASLAAIEVPLRQAAAAATAARKFNFSLQHEVLSLERLLSDLRSLLLRHPSVGLKPPSWLAPIRVEKSGFVTWWTAIFHDGPTAAAADELAATLHELLVDEAYEL